MKWSLALLYLALGASLVLGEKDDGNTLDGTEEIKSVFDEAFYIQAHGYISQGKPFKNFTLEDTIYFINDVNSWRAPQEIIDGFPYFLSGYDYEDRPVWIGEVGKYRVRDVVERGQESMDALEKYCFQAAINVLSSMKNGSRLNGKEVTQYILLTDFDKMELSQFAHPATIAWGISVLRRYLDMFVAALWQLIGINVSYTTKQLIDLFRPAIGGFFERIETYGPNKAKWLPILKRNFPPEALPQWYGGTNDWKPVIVYG